MRLNEAINPGWCDNCGDFLPLLRRVDVEIRDSDGKYTRPLFVCDRCTVLAERGEWYASEQRSP